MSDPVAHTSKEDSKSEEFRDGDVFIRSSDRVLFQVHLENLKFVSTVFPSSISASDKAIDFEEDSETLEILFYFAYPHKPLPQLYSLPFKTLMKVLEASDKWGVRHAVEFIQVHLQKYASMYPKEILASAPNQDCSFLAAAVAPYLVNMSVAEMQSLGLSDRLCVKWAIYRENILMALYEGRRNLGNHDSECDKWRSRIRLFLLNKLEAPTGPRFLSGRAVRGTYTDVITWMSNLPGYNSTPCCRVALEKWRELTLEKLDAVQFPV